MLRILPDFREEGWHSMDLCAEMLLKNCPPGFRMEMCQPKFRKILGWLPGSKAKNFDRLYNRWIVYPSLLKRSCEKRYFFHLVDHSYSHLLHYLPEGRVGVYCHDFDAFRCVLEPEKEQRPVWFQKMMSKVFDGFKKAKVVFCNSLVTRSQIINLGIWKETDVVLTHLGVSDEFILDGEKFPGNYLLHVGSCIPRKRVDILIDIFAKIHSIMPEIGLIQAGGTFTDKQVFQINRHGISDSVKQIRGLGRDGLARLYRGARCLLVTSEAEGFGLPVIEALSCGCPVVANDIPTLREAGSDLVTFCKIDDLDLWAQNILEVINNLDRVYGYKSKGFLDRYSWKKHSEVISKTYSNLMAL